MKSSTCNATVGIFDTRSAADKAIADLKADGFRDEDISLVWKEKGQTHHTDGAGETSKEKGAALGGTVGAATGAAAGAAVTAGLISGVIPVIGPVVAMGVLGTALLNAAGTAAAVGLAGALVGWGVTEDDAKYYEGQVAAGRYLVTVNCGNRAEKTTRIYNRNGGIYRTPVENPALKV